MLNGLKKKFPLAYQRFHIDLILDDQISALTNLSEVILQTENLPQTSEEVGETKASIFLTECLEHIKKHRIFSHALKLFEGSVHYQVINHINHLAMQQIN